MRCKVREVVERDGVVSLPRDAPCEFLQLGFHRGPVVVGGRVEMREGDFRPVHPFTVEVSEKRAGRIDQE
jgi:hypothetical protein